MEIREQIENRSIILGDSLNILRSWHDEGIREFLDLIYADGPFNSKRDHNIIVPTDTLVSEEAFRDTWSSVHYLEELDEISKIDMKLYDYLKAMKDFLPTGHISYLTTMAIRIWYQREMLKPTGSFYYHCDSTMSHYIKGMLDRIFGIKNFRNEIIWKRSSPHSLSKGMDNITDTILYYTKSERYVMNTQYMEFENLDKFKTLEVETGRHFQTSPMENRANFKYNDEVRIFYDVLGNKIEKRTSIGWKWSQKTIDERWKGNPYMFYFTKNGKVRYKNYADEFKGNKFLSLWDDIPGLSSMDKERFGYATQKPEKLLERIIKTSSNPGDFIADFFVGGGTTVIVAEKNGRKWLACDINHKAVYLVRDRIEGHYLHRSGGSGMPKISLHGMTDSSKELRELMRKLDEEETSKGKYYLQDIILKFYLPRLMPLSNCPQASKRKTDDHSIDGMFPFRYNNERMRGIIQVTAGSNKNHFKSFLEESSKNNLGIYISFEDRLPDSRYVEAKEKGKLGNVDRLQILTIEDVVDNKKGPHIPGGSSEYIEYF